ncbi:hypothetical protein FE249_20085 (plasmid) [Acidiphilium multivorum]|uniref:hypothetical protein n=1 Tax=Acidiphilium multivorum TaxID=62140 RepID=UPI001F4C01A7|nr:hypothetical protein [Acidiphilium multivorum]UNC16475.1 hypothetical protein FE249_20085 [Acidiphilium multivorum]
MSENLPAVRVRMAYWRHPKEWAPRIVEVTLDDLARYGIRPLAPSCWAQHGGHLDAYLLPGATEISVGIRYEDGPAEYLSLLADQQDLRALLAEKMAERADSGLRRFTAKVELKRLDDDAVIGMHEHDIRATSKPAAITEALRRSYEAVSRGVKFEGISCRIRSIEEVAGSDEPAPEPSL